MGLAYRLRRSLKRNIYTCLYSQTIQMFVAWRALFEGALMRKIVNWSTGWTRVRLRMAIDDNSYWTSSPISIESYSTCALSKGNRWLSKWPLTSFEYFDAGKCLKQWVSGNKNVKYYMHEKLIYMTESSSCPERNLGVNWIISQSIILKCWSLQQHNIEATGTYHPHNDGYHCWRAHLCSHLSQTSTPNIRSGDQWHWFQIATERWYL